MKKKIYHFGLGDQIDFTVVEGRLTPKEFNSILKADKDQSELRFDKEFIEYRFGIITKKGIKWARINNLKAKIYTVGCW
jgi:hypothetical protein